jgi:polyferredoxin
MVEQKSALKANGYILPKIRRTIQIAMLAVLGNWAFYGIFRCPFLVPFVNCQSCPVITCWGRIVRYFWSFWLFLPASVLLGGRAFCGWLCPGGFINQMIGRISFFKLRVRNRLLNVAMVGMAVSLITVLILWLGINNPRSLPPIRIGDFWSSVLFSFQHASLGWLLRTYIVLGLVAAGLFVANLWCRFVCPTGGLLELFKGLAVFRVFKSSACNDCNACLRICEMGTRPGETNCTNCGDCLQSCPVDAIHFGRKRQSDE